MISFELISFLEYAGERPHREPEALTARAFGPLDQQVQNLVVKPGEVDTQRFTKFIIIYGITKNFYNK